MEKGKETKTPRSLAWAQTGFVFRKQILEKKKLKGPPWRGLILNLKK